MTEALEVRFGPFRLDPAEERLWQGEKVVKLTPKAFSVLRYLAERPKRLITKDELFKALWPDTVVSDAALTRCIRELRGALSDDPRSPRYVETVHRRGFRFVGPAPDIGESVTRTETRYAKSGDVHIAYQVVGDGPTDLVMVPGWATNVEGWWELPLAAAFYERLASFCRLVIFDKRGTGMSDPVPINELPTLEQRMDDVRVIMDTVRIKRAVLFGYSEGGPMSLLFAATYPERTAALILHGTFAKLEWDDCFAASLADTPEQLEAMIEEHWADGFPGLEVWAPTFADREENRRAFAHFMRLAASPAAAMGLIRMNWQIDVRPILPAIRAPTLILHRRGERAIGVKHARYLADHIPGARYVEMPGVDHLFCSGDHEAIAATIEEFLKDARAARKPDRVVATVLFGEIVHSTGRAAELSGHWQDLVRKILPRFGGRGGAGDQCLASFDGPIRALRCALSLREGARRLGFEIHAGVHTGECEFKGDRLGGTALRIASQVLAATPPGEIWVSRTTKDIVAGSGIEFRDRGFHVLDNLPGRYSLFSVESTSSDASIDRRD